MKKAFSAFLVFCILLSGCAQITSAVSLNTPSIIPSSTQAQVIPSEAASKLTPAQSSDQKQDQSSTKASSQPSQSSQSNTVKNEDNFWIRFLDVGQADSALVMCGGKYMLIDGGNVADSSLVYSCLKSIGVETLDYIICTHGHEDHVGGLSGALNACGVKTVLSSCKTYDSKAFRDFQKFVELARVQITIPSANSEYTLGEAKFKILSPSVSYSDENNNSIALKLEYGDTSFLFMGDAEREVEQDIINSEYSLKSDLIKIGHHGSETSTSYVFLREVMPQYAIISVGAGNSYGHPHENTLSRLHDADVTTFRTDQNGDIIVKSDGKKLTLSTTKKTTVISSVPTVASKETSSTFQTGEYIGNINSKVIHRASCSYLPDPGNRVYFATLEAALAQGYRPCGQCHPDGGSAGQTSRSSSVTITSSTTNTGNNFIGNKNTKKVHLPSCSSLPDLQNRVYFQTYKSAITAGYDPCQKCHPER